MKWKKIDNYAIGADNYTIAKVIVAGNAKYVLWEVPDKMVKIFNTAQEAKNEAMEHYKRKPAISDRAYKFTRPDGAVGGGYKKEKKGAEQ